MFFEMMCQCGDIGHVPKLHKLEERENSGINVHIQYRFTLYDCMIRQAMIRNDRALFNQRQPEHTVYVHSKLYIHYTFIHTVNKKYIHSKIK